MACFGSQWFSIAIGALIFSTDNNYLKSQSVPNKEKQWQNSVFKLRSFTNTVGVSLINAMIHLHFVPKDRCALIPISPAHCIYVTAYKVEQIKNASFHSVMHNLPIKV